MFNKKFKEYDLFYSISESRLHNTQNIIVHCIVPTHDIIIAMLLGFRPSE